MQRDNWLSGAGNMRNAIGTCDWSATAIGPVIGWSEVLRNTIELMLPSPTPMLVCWGSSGLMVYNDAFARFIGDREAKLLGLPIAHGWPEAAAFHQQLMAADSKISPFPPTELELDLDRLGWPERVFCSLGLSPIVDSSACPAGVLAIVTDTTQSVSATIGLRANEERLRFLDMLGKETASLIQADQILATTTRMLGEFLGVSICAYADMEADEDHFTIRGDWSAEGSPSIRGYYSLAAFGVLAVSNLKLGKPLVINDNRTEIAPSEAATFQSIGITATICMPLVKNGRLTALMAIHHKDAHQWTEQELSLLGEVTERSWAHIERVRSEAASRQRDAQFRTLAEALPCHVWTATPDGLLDWFNQQVYAFSGAQPGTLDGQGWAGIVHPEDVAAAASAWQSAVERGTHYQIEFRLRRADGAWRWHLTRAVPLTSSSGQIVRWVGTNTDVDDQKNAEELLERRLEERTASLAETSERLQQSQKMEAIGNLTGGVAHDFNNLLSAIMGSLELLRKRLPDDPNLRRLVDTALEGANRGASLTRRMLAFARKQDLKADRIAVGTLIAGMRELLERSLGPMIQVDVSIEEKLPLVEADANQLEAALLNLALNSRDAMNGSGRLGISAESMRLNEPAHGLNPGSYMRLTVTDSGEGMDEATLNRATEPFFTTKGVGKGTGLGLSMVHGLAVQSGGMLVLKSRLGVGTTAEIWLPVANETLEVRQATTPIPHSEVQHRPLRILAVDDDFLVLMNTTSMLEDLGHVVFEAASGKDALKQLETNQPVDLVITDHAMPQMTGTELSNEIRQQWPSMPILLATGYAELPGGNALQLPRLQKPFGQDDLRRAIEGFSLSAPNQL